MAGEKDAASIADFEKSLDELEKLVHDLQGRGLDAHYFSNTDAILDFLAESSESGDIIAILSNGGFDNIHQRLLTIISDLT